MENKGLAIFMIASTMFLLFCIGSCVQNKITKNSQEKSWVTIELHYTNGYSEIKTFTIQTNCIEFTDIRRESNVFNNLPPKLMTYSKSGDGCGFLFSEQLAIGVEQFKIIKTRPYVSKNKD